MEKIYTLFCIFVIIVIAAFDSFMSLSYALKDTNCHNITASDKSLNVISIALESAVQKLHFEVSQLYNNALLYTSHCIRYIIPEEKTALNFFTHRNTSALYKHALNIYK
jgi:hypothetical protein